MRPTEVSIEEATAAPPALSYSRQDVLDNLLQQHPSWVRGIHRHYAGDWDELTAYLATLPDKQDNELVATFLGLVLLHLGQRQGLETFVRAMGGANPQHRALALDQLIYLGHDPAREDALPADWAPALVDALAAELVRDPDGGYAERILDYFTRGAPQAAHRQLAALRSHPHPALCGPAIKHLFFLEQDELTYDIVAGHLLEPGIRKSKDLQHRGRLLHDLCMYLMWDASSEKQWRRERAMALACQVLRESIAAKDAPERLRAFGFGWLYAEHLLDAVAANKSGEAAALLQEVAAFRALDPVVRATALVRHHAMTGLVLPVRATVVADLLQPGVNIGMTGDILAPLAESGLVTPGMLVHAAGLATWTYPATRELAKLPRDDSADSKIVAGLRRPLAIWAADYPSFEEQFRYLVGLLQQLPRSEQDNRDIAASLERALASARSCTDKPWLAREVMAHMAALGLAASLDLDSMRPWDAMDQHWLRTGMTWIEAAGLLAEAGVIDELEPERVAALGPGGRAGLESLCGNTGSRVPFASLSDIGYEHHHDELFAKLAAAVRPAVELDAVVQRGEMDFTPAPDEDRPGELLQIGGVQVYTTEGTLMEVLVYHRGRGFSFRVAPQGTYLDTWAVLHGFDRFMEQIGRPERAWWLGDAHEGDDWGLFVCADPARFGPVRERLRLPVRVAAR
jgi:hypothetical protein